MENLKEDSWERGFYDLQNKLKGQIGQRIFIATQKITPYIPGRLHGKLFKNPNHEERFSLGILESDEIRPDVPMIIPTERYISRTRNDDYDSGWIFGRGSITGLFDLSSLGKFERHIFTLPQYCEKDGFLIYVGDEINQNIEFLNLLGYQEANELLRFEQERLPEFAD
ncbi:hypothetical protein HYT25_03105 [Candidatus Pacearchaeota archaeon]|nr:hypothetical protein [Candidatus Pacearchaeota archaeon]